MNHSKLDQALKALAIRAALASGKVLMKYFGKTSKLKIRNKPGAGIVTQADLHAEKVALAILRKTQKTFSVLTEETGTIGDTQKPGRWILDPLDGTTNFAHGYPMFCVSIAAEWEGEIRVGVIYHAPLGDLYVAVKGKGAWLNGKRLRVSSTRSVRDSLLTTGFSYQRNPELRREIQAFEKISMKSRGIRRPGSAALDLAFTSRGIFDGYWERGLKPWDIAAGILLVKEAGGRVTNYEGEPLVLAQNEVLASNSWLHPHLIRTLRR